MKTQSFIKQIVDMNGTVYEDSVKEVEPPKVEFEEYEVHGRKVKTSAIKPLEMSIIFYRHDPDFMVNSRKNVDVFVNTVLEDSDGTVRVISESASGTIFETESSKFERGKEVEFTVKINVEKYKKQVNGKTVYDINIKNNIIEVDGLDLLQEVKKYLV